MNKTVISDKYQVVIPKAVREALKLKKRQILRVYKVDGGVLLAPEKKWPDDYIGIDKDLWSKIDVADYLKGERDSWD